MAFAVARRAAAVPLLLINGTYRKTVRTYLDSSILQFQLQRLNKHGSLKGLSYILKSSCFRRPIVCTWKNKNMLGNPFEIEKRKGGNVFCPLICAYAAHSIFIHPTFLFQANLLEFYFEIFIQLNKYLSQRIRDVFRMSFANSLEDAWCWKASMTYLIWDECSISPKHGSWIRIQIMYQKTYFLNHESNQIMYQITYFTEPSHPWPNPVWNHDLLGQNHLIHHQIVIPAIQDRFLGFLHKNWVFKQFVSSTCWSVLYSTIRIVPCISYKACTVRYLLHWF